ncbi:MAG: hypothetical protein Q8L62_05925 [Candidatus Nitrotoga sp.]|nr:hypothetical protein [Candidatus Nitrotoga sp.]
MDLSLHNPVELVAKLANGDLDPLVLRRCAPLTQQLQNSNVMHFLILNAAFIPSPMPCRRWGAGAFFALLKSAMSDYKYQEKAAPHARGLIRNVLPSVVALTGDS